MAHFSLSALGAFQATLDGELITDFKSNKVRALLAYLTVEADRPHSREMLAGLLWPEWPNRAALSNLRYALSNLRKAIGDRTAEPPFLLITRSTIQFNSLSDYWLDVAAFQQHIADSEQPTSVNDRQSSAIIHLRSAVGLYRGNFLEGFSLTGSAPFEEWAWLREERLKQQMLRALHRLASIYEQRGDYEQAQVYARRQLELEPWLEEAHQQLIRLLALSGQRSAALAQYETCYRLLAKELGVEPTAETAMLYEQIRDGLLSGQRVSRGSVSPVPAHLPLRSDSWPSTSFVAREHELAKLDRFLAEVLAGQGRIMFVTGEAGSGKTALVEAFARRAMTEHSELLVAQSDCSACTGFGDPYLPFRTILQLLTGDIEAKRAGGVITPEHARRLWEGVPQAIQTLVEEAPGLMDSFISASVLQLHAEAFASPGLAWQAKLAALASYQHDGDRTAPSHVAAVQQQSHLFKQITHFFQSLARWQPLMLVIDDLQWADEGTVALLFHLGRHLVGYRILLVGVYRQEEVMARQAGRRHPLAPVIHELQRRLGDIQIDLNQTDNWAFLHAYLDSKPNRLGPDFRQTLYRYTGGQALFTVELLRDLEERGNLGWDEAGRWVDKSDPDWQHLPPRVEAVIAERTQRLAQAWQTLLTVASVEGEVFTAEVVARVADITEGEAIQLLSGVLSKQYRLVKPYSLQRVKEQRLSHYRFRHALFQTYLYHRLDEMERAHLHQAVGEALEEIYQEQAEDITIQLARHFEAAGITAKAIDHLLQAGHKAMQLYAPVEAMALFTRGLALLQTLPDSPQRTEQELGLQMAISVPLLAMQGWGASERAQACRRAYELCQQTGNETQLMQALFLNADMHRARGEHRRSLELGQQLLELTQTSHDVQQMALAHWTLGETHFFRGELLAAQDHLTQALTLYDAHHSPALTPLTATDLGVTCLTWLSWTLWSLGYPDQGLVRLQEALALAQTLDHPLSQAFALTLGAYGFHWLRREPVAAHRHHAALVPLMAREDLTSTHPWGHVFQGWVKAEQGQLAQGIAEMEAGAKAWQAMGAVSGRICQALPLIEAYERAGKTGAASRLLDETLSLVEQTGERFFEAELYQLKGELLLMRGDDHTQVEACYLQAVKVAHRQRAKSWELQATMSLGRLWQRQGKREEARRMLAEIYGWFTEGVDTPDLEDARELLEELE
ncbi:MAG TPA: hypothetical protein EYP04_06790 [Anaerolineae bacterium]|nr:hypothetical protein [Anaerolineae bacterium]HIQ04680.1 hypothetical protein [Anaerolineae bacterium]